MFDLKLIDAIIFDFGGVILNLDYNRTIRAFEALGLIDFEQRYTQAKQEGVFDDMETGRISEDEFRDRLRALGPKGMSDEQIDHAWNAMLLDLPSTRPALLSELGQLKRTFLLSNTNVIHARQFETYIKDQHNGLELKSLFEAAYYSHEIGLRKPDPAIFLQLIRNHSLIPNRTLFIDDSIQHIEGAQTVGLQTLHLTADQTIESIFEGQMS